MTETWHEDHRYDGFFDEIDFMSRERRKPPEMSEAAQLASEAFYAKLREPGSPVDSKQLVLAWEAAARAVLDADPPVYIIPKDSHILERIVASKGLVIEWDDGSEARLKQALKETRHGQ
jgi:hypothetical protein